MCLAYGSVLTMGRWLGEPDLGRRSAGRAGRRDKIATAILTMSASSDTKTLNFWYSRLAFGRRSRVRSGPHDCRLPASPVRFPDPDGQGHTSRLLRLRRSCSMACDRMATVIKPALPERADAESGYGEPPLDTTSHRRSRPRTMHGMDRAFIELAAFSRSKSKKPPTRGRALAPIRRRTQSRSQAERSSSVIWSKRSKRHNVRPHRRGAALSMAASPDLRSSPDVH
jgi:hypothetical protein